MPSNKQAPSVPDETERLDPKLAFVIYAGLFGLAWFWFSAQGGDITSWYPGSKSPFGHGVLYGAMTGGLIVVSTRLATRYVERFRKLVSEVAILVGEQGHLSIFFLALASSVGEEALFRGALQPQLGLIGTSILFGFLHGLPGTRFAAWGWFAIVAGFCFGGLAEWSGDLWAATTAHFTVNFLNLYALVRLLRERNAPGTLTEADHRIEEPNL